MVLKEDKSTGFGRELSIAVRAARSAAGVIRAAAGRIQEKDIRAKGINDLVTVVDVEAEKVITDILRDAFPDYKILAEEDVAEAEPLSLSAGYQWIVDPIDGTTNFMHGVPPYAVSIGLQKDGEMVVAVVLDVSRNELFTAESGKGLFIDGQPASVSKTAKMADALMTTGFPYRRFEDVDAYLEVLRSVILSSRGIRRPGSASVDLAYVAAGRFDGFYETGLAPWDVAAGVLLVREAGGTVTDFEGGADVVFERQIVASNGKIHEEILGLLDPIRASRA